MDIGTLVGFVLAFIGIVIGQILEGGSIGQLTQPTAFLIVMGGTTGAVMISFPLKTFLAAMKDIKNVFFDKAHKPDELVQELLRLANKARKDGIVSLEQDIPKISDNFLREALRMAVDGIDPKEMRATLELRIEQIEEHLEHSPKVFEAFGGYSPTIGIIGAVLGLIQVMQNLNDITAVGHGIAVAFVATIYGVAFANVVFLPASTKLKLKGKHEITTKLACLDAVASIVEGMNPRLIEAKLRSYFVGELAPEEEGARKAA